MVDMPNITLYVSDEEYVNYVTHKEEVQEVFKQEFKKFIKKLQSKKRGGE